MSIERILSPDFGHIFQGIPKPEPIRYETPDFGNPDQQRDIGVIDFNEVTAGRREDVALIHRWKEKRDRNATPRTGGDEPEAA